MPGKMNKQWHDANPMPKPATLDARVEWHLAHREHCACREMPATVIVELQRRGIEVASR